jgi:SPP1 family predicted phage head-tail adaptor
MTAFGTFRHLVTLEAPGDPVPDGSGGYTEGWAPLTPAAWHCAIEAATAADLERLIAGTAQTTATHLVRGRFHPGITTATRITFRGRVLEVQSVQNDAERNLTLTLVCAEVQ